MGATKYLLRPLKVLLLLLLYLSWEGGSNQGTPSEVFPRTKTLFYWVTGTNHGILPPALNYILLLIVETQIQTLPSLALGDLQHHLLSIRYCYPVFLSPGPLFIFAEGCVSTNLAPQHLGTRLVAAARPVPSSVPLTDILPAAVELRGSPPGPAYNIVDSSPVTTRHTFASENTSCTGELFVSCALLAIIALGVPKALLPLPLCYQDPHRLP